MDLGATKGRGAAAIAFAVSVAAAASGAAATQNELPVLGRLERGLWQLRNLGGGGSLGAVCLGDPAALTQLRHRGRSCQRSVVARTRDSIEVRYACRAGFGQTTVRVETPRLARIEGQGVDNGVPFGFRAEARRVGACR